MPRALRSERARTAKPKKVMARMIPATMVQATNKRPSPAKAEPSRKNPSSAQTRLVKGSCSTVRAIAFTRSACSSVMAKESSRPRMRTRTLLSSVDSGATWSGVTHPAD